MADVLDSKQLACLREDEPFHLFMLDHDPAAAASMYTDHHLSLGVISAARLLSTAWHIAANQFWVPLYENEEPEATPWFDWRADSATWVDVGETTGRRWFLHNQPVFNRYWAHRPLPEWTAALGGNYNWLWQHGMALAGEHRRRFGLWHRCEKNIWTLEVVPPPLLSTLGEWGEIPPEMSEHIKVLDADGCYDSVASYRNYYNLLKRPLHAWRRPATTPDWIG